MKKENREEKNLNDISLKNLKTPTSEEAKERGSKGGICSGQAKRQRRAIREYVGEALNANLQSENSINLLSRFLPDTPISQQNILLLGVVKVIKDFISDDVRPLERLKIFEFLRDTIGEKPVNKMQINENKVEEYELDKKLAQLSTEELKEILYGEKI